MKEIKVINKIIGEGHPVFIIAEAGVNHNGDLDLAFKLIDVAVDAGVDAVKFQTFNAETLVTRDAKQAEYQSQNIGKEESQFEMLKRLELSKEDHKELFDYANKSGIIFLSTPFSDIDTDFLDGLGVPLFKVGSSDTNNYPSLRHIASKGKPMIVSSGMSTLEEVCEAVSVMKDSGNNDIVILHCNTQYPTPMEEVNLLAMLTMKEKCDVLVGYSDHTTGIEVPIAAVALGAVVIEKHFTLDRNMEGPDHKASLEPAELQAMVKAIRNTEKALGSSEKKPTEVAVEVAQVAQKSLISARNIKAGEIINKEDIVIKRPGSGIKPKELEKVVGKKALVDIPADTMIKWEDIK
ncbi:MAG: N-acetylneuraminate synthase [bacterium]|nr:N-acetylneuraminate synthase [bacterium]